LWWRSQSEVRGRRSPLLDFAASGIRAPRLPLSEHNATPGFVSTDLSISVQFHADQCEKCLEISGCVTTMTPSSTSAYEVQKHLTCKVTDKLEESIDSELGGFILSFIEDRHRRCTPCVGIMSICFAFPPTCIRLLGAGGEDIRVTCRLLACEATAVTRLNLPASRMDMVEQRKSLPQAVPSSICIASMLVAALRSHNRTSSQGQPSENTQSIPEYLVVRP
jgi:hypothetical protein